MYSSRPTRREEEGRSHVPTILGTAVGGLVGSVSDKRRSDDEYARIVAGRRQEAAEQFSTAERLRNSIAAAQRQHDEVLRELDTGVFGDSPMAQVRAKLYATSKDNPMLLDSLRKGYESTFNSATQEAERGIEDALKRGHALDDITDIKRPTRYARTLLGASVLGGVGHLYSSLQRRKKDRS